MHDLPVAREGNYRSCPEGFPKSPYVDDCVRVFITSVGTRTRHAVYEHRQRNRKHMFVRLFPKRLGAYVWLGRGEFVVYKFFFHALVNWEETAAEPIEHEYPPKSSSCGEALGCKRVFIVNEEEEKIHSCPGRPGLGWFSLASYHARTAGDSKNVGFALEQQWTKKKNWLTSPFHSPVQTSKSFLNACTKHVPDLQELSTAYCHSECTIKGSALKPLFSLPKLINIYQRSFDLNDRRWLLGPH